MLATRFFVVDRSFALLLLCAADVVGCCARIGRAEVPAANRDYQFSEFLPGFFGFGSSGGASCWLWTAGVSSRGQWSWCRLSRWMAPRHGR